MSKSYTGINIQYPISRLIIDGEKTIETRTYPLPEKYLNQELLLVETPGSKGKFKSRIVGIIKFTNCFLYQDKKAFNQDYEKHFVDKDSDWWWTDKPKYGWEVKLIKVFKEPIPFLGRKGIKFTLNIKI